MHGFANASSSLNSSAQLNQASAAHSQVVGDQPICLRLDNMLARAQQTEGALSGLRNTLFGSQPEPGSLSAENARESSFKDKLDRLDSVLASIERLTSTLSASF